MIRNFKELKEPDRVFSKEFTSKVRDSGLGVRLESGSSGDEIKWWRAAATKSETAVDIGDKGCYSSGHREEDLMLPTSCWSMSSFESCTNEGVSAVTTLNCWRMYAFSGRKVKERAYKEDEGILLQQRGLLLAWPLPYSRSCLQALLVLVGEVTVGDKQWFSSESFCLGPGSGVFASFPLTVAAEFMAVHEISYLYSYFPEPASNHAILSRLTRTNGGTIACSSSHLLGVDIPSIGKIILSRLMQRVAWNPLAISRIKENWSLVGPIIDFCKLVFTLLKVPGLTKVLSPSWSSNTKANFIYAAFSVHFDFYQGNWHCKAYGESHANYVMQVFTSFESA
ncbi:hypothetical protein V6N13_067200 [Hibiscus sabdariffa]